MSDERIQAGPSAADPMVDQLLRQVQTLEADKRRWKATALVCLLLLLLAVIGGGLGMLGVGSIYLSQVKRAEEQARQQELAYQEAEMARQQAAMAAQQRQLERERIEAQRATERAERNFEKAK